ncbi:BNR repeat domain [Micractinium conductrix]|uniref:BNR repeat domain n=1 Tax=Micractinium conductrix TaxID=554055 RepID=A0A2P6V9Z1_9CHLO|nr:BNR repeat domain [Micractinium conductrix]|eukprot:PSC70909.1 BNR repeat domain [Micractinium conductrix]
MTAPTALAHSNKCDGTNKVCTIDAVADTSVVCRPANGPCDVEDKCDGTNKACTADAKQPATFECNPARDLCDAAETCDAVTILCPTDVVRRDKGKGFKCGRDCFYCGAESAKELTQMRNTVGLGSCNMGTPAHTTYCVGPVLRTCPNVKALSNVVHAVCNGATGGWTCVDKQDGTFTGPVYPPPPPRLLTSQARSVMASTSICTSAMSRCTLGRPAFCKAAAAAPRPSARARAFSAQAAAVPAAAHQRANNMLPFGRAAVELSADDLVVPSFPLPASNREQAPCIQATAPRCYASGAGEFWSAAGTRTDVNAGVAAAFRGLTPDEVEGVVRAHCPRLLAAVAAATGDARASPAAAAPSLRRLSAKFGTLLRLVAPGGTSAAAQPFAGLPALLDACTAATHSLAAAGSHRAAFVAAQAGLRLLSHLSFGCRVDAAPYLAAALSFKLAATAAMAAGTPVTERDVLALTAACARASGHLQMTPYYGHAYAAAVDALITDGWSSAQSAVEYAQSWCTLVAAGRLHFVPAKYARLLAAAQSHAHLTARQLDALLATQRTLPAHMTTPINAWLADWQAEASGRRASQQQQQRRRVAAAEPVVAVPAGARASSFARYAVL